MFRFTIRELILLTVIVAMGAAWWVDHQRITPEERDFLRRWKLNWESVRAREATAAPGVSRPTSVPHP